MKIVDIRLKEIEERLASKKLKLSLDASAKRYLGSIGYSTSYGARPLNRAIQQELLNPLAMLILEERIRDGEVVRVTLDEPRNRLYIKPNHEGTGVPMDVDGMYEEEPEIEEMD
jgi:ATP-dependent Clp protease ATP-binding subunit ClpB